MKLKSLLVAAFLLAISGLISSCSTSRSVVNEAPAGDFAGSQDGSGKIDPQKLQSQEKLIEAKKMELLGDDQQALNLYKECIKTDPANDAAYYNAAKIF